ncbi:MAG TPA: trehalose-phosphatase [Dehalococcoidia bacterium]
MAKQLRDIEPIRPLLAHRSLAVFSDIDGTLAPIVPDPTDARVSDRAREALRDLMALGVGVGLITGRDLAKAREMTGLPEAWFAANHGLTLSIDGDDETPEAASEFVTRARDVIRETAGVESAGVSVEDKGPIVAFHYRRAPSPEEARAAIEAALDSSAAAVAFRVHEGRMVVELRPALEVDKGTALEELSRRMRAGAVICIGDDRTDVDMFRRVTAMRDAGTPGATVAVDSPEVTAEVLAGADYCVDGVAGVEWLLEEIATALRVIAASGH